jgi:hypothetical protein
MVGRHQSLTTNQPESPAIRGYEQDWCCARTFVCNTDIAALQEAIHMPKIENPHHIQIALDGQRAKISQSEYELLPDEWYRRRTDAFAQLRRVGGIPDEIIELVEHFEEQTLVQPFVYRPGKKVELRFGVKVLGTQKGADKAKRLAEMIAVGKRLHAEEREEMTASEALAFLLRISLRALKHAEKSRRAAPVRTLNLAPRSLIAEIAMDLLGSCETWGYPPGPLLNSLIQELLNLEHDRQGMSRDVERQEQAAGIVAQAPTVRTRELARALHVNASTISRWRKSPEFKQMVERKAEILKDRADVGDLKDRADVGERILSYAQKGPMQKEAIALLVATAARLYKPKDID